VPFCRPNILLNSRDSGIFSEFETELTEFAALQVV
jgi:hypothetical protein